MTIKATRVPPGQATGRRAGSELFTGKVVVQPGPRRG